ncbi:hypothetical protein EGR_06921 [Echinococcus granulosus]|uniref:DUF5727 domain-containing protein n=1 Tax=Echinococcus granulosus TaxID=6210 RepID=W6UJ45_ECHGR|nr:hypothetical protein EGR_06921 [Echinococcus granulosus]EUB58177.1 hypothetical protein EGR_06921 [Echinococcus granulosus]
MLKVAVFLITVAYYSGAEPVLWGSRIVGTPAGQSPTMYFRLPKFASIVALIDGIRIPIGIKDGKCYLNDNQEWGSPCEMDEESANITLKDVSKQEALQILSLHHLTSAAFFVPTCTFQKPKQGNMSNDTGSDLRTFVWNVTRNNTVNYTTIQWSAGNNALAVNIDWTQDGASPEIEECNSYRVTTSK